jgi:hypothetical protein
MPAASLISRRAMRKGTHTKKGHGSQQAMKLDMEANCLYMPWTSVMHKRTRHQAGQHHGTQIATGNAFDSYKHNAKCIATERDMARQHAVS